MKKLNQATRVAMDYDALEEERRWRQKRPKAGKKQVVLTERHHFPHRLVRSKLLEALIGPGCTDKSTVIEIGCGSGEDMEFISQASRNITGVDISPEALNVYRQQGFRGVLADAGNLPFAANSFDYVLYPAILHHLVGQGNLAPYLKEAARLTRQGGYVMALEPNLFNISGILMNIFNTVKPGITGLVPHERALSPLYLIKIFREAGLKDVKCVSASFTWNRFPLCFSMFISRHEDSVRHRKPFNLLGWFSIIWGRKS
ncbi:class I SAM-dependent methyltransferase [Chloroflexota bacterium]